MARKSAKTGGAAQLRAKPAAKSKKVESESEAESEASENFMQFKKGKKHDSDEEEDREVFNLAMNDDDSENENDSADNQSDDDDDDEDDSQATSEDDDDDDDYEGDELRNLVDNLPQNLRQKVLMKKGEEDSDSEGGESENEEEEEGWGKKKSTYWSGDTADLEIGQSMEDAEEEEAAAQELQKGKLARMKASDFYEEFDNEEDSEEEESEAEEEQNMGSKIKNNKKQTAAATESKVSAKAAKKLLKKTVSGNNDDKVIADLEMIALGKSNNADVQVEKLQKDISKLSKQQKLDLLQAQSPELLGIVNELKERVSDLKNNLQPLKDFLLKVAAMTRIPDDIVEYLEVKEQLLLAYCTNVVFYLYMKAQGKSVRAHPVMKQLLKLRYVMEKMRPLDNKLKYQIDRLVKLSELSPQEAAGQVAGLLRPNPSALLGRDGGGDTDEDEHDYSDAMDEVDSDEEDGRRGGKKSGSKNGSGVELYKAPKISAMPYEENETQSAKRDSRMEKQRKKLRHSELMDTLREEFGSAPEMAGSGGLGRASGDLKALQEEAEERKRFEEERFVRMTMSRKDKKDIKRRTAEATRLDNFDDIGDIGDFEEFAKMARQSSGLSEGDSLAEALGKKGRKGSKNDADDVEEGGKSSRSTAAALQRAVDALAQSGDSKKSKKDKKGGSSDDALVMPGERKKISAEDVAAALSGGFGDFDDDDEDFGSSKKGSKKAAKKSSSSKPNYEDFGGDDDDEDVDPYSAFLEADSRKRRRAPDDRMNDFNGGGNDSEGDEDDNLVEEFGQKKKAFLSKKKDHYTAEPRYGGREETVEGDRKRAATYEIMKNKGLTPHRKKEARNPRVMKRMKYEKAQIARKGQVREVIKGAAGAYGGEMTGIKAGISRSRRM